MLKMDIKATFFILGRFDIKSSLVIPIRRGSTLGWALLISIRGLRHYVENLLV